MNIVVGSGPSGVAVAEALLAGGEQVTLIDVGRTLEPHRQASKQRLAARDPTSWTPADLAFLNSAPTRPGEVPDKTSFGSDFPYASPAAATPIESQGVGLKPSFALGGLSTVWGSALLAFQDSDIADWPITSRDLQEGYVAASRLLPLSARRDDLAAAFPLFREPEACLTPSRQGRGLLASLDTHRGRLRAEGVTFGAARLAVQATPCVSCGLCLRGCPRDLIYSTRATLDRQRAGLTYQPDTIVRAITEDGNGVEVHAVRLDGSSFSIRGGRVFLGAGVINTTEILLRSMGWFDRSVHIKDAQYFLIPALRWRGTSGVERERLNTLCQAFIELDDPMLSPFTIHLQAYGYNDIIRDLVLTKVGRWHKVLPVGALLGRLMVLQSYLHSDQSGTIEVTLRGDRLSLDGRPQAATAPIVAATARKLGRLARLTGLSPIKAMIEITQPGRGFHSGGSFPMARNPGLGQTDLIGRPHGFSRVHLVDSSTFPSIPATTITLAVMANAYRIGVAAAGLA